MLTRTCRLPCLSLVLLLAACPADKGTTEGGTTADTGTTGPATTGPATDTAATGSTTTGSTTAGSDTAVTEFTTADLSSTSQGESTSAQESSTGASGTDTTGTSTDTTGTTSGTSGTTGEPAIACGGDMPYFPEFDRSCTEPADCALALHQIDCCGSLAALGISSDTAKLFGEAEAECMMQYPQCDCAAQPTVADDGSSTPDNNSIEVTCVDGQCVSFVP